MQSITLPNIQKAQSEFGRNIDQNKKNYSPKTTQMNEEQQ